MKYYLDTEFHEYKKKPRFGKAIDTIELISIGIVSERLGEPANQYDNDMRCYYAICNEFDLKAAWNNKWLRENVLKPIHYELAAKVTGLDMTYEEWMIVLDYEKNYNSKHSLKVLKQLLSEYGKSRKQISEEIIEFVNQGISDIIYAYTRHDSWSENFYSEEFAYIKSHSTHIPDVYYPSGIDGSGYEKNKKLIFNKPEFYAYYADYDWVVFCWLYGRMIDLPKGFPMYCRDLKQELDNIAIPLWKGTETETDDLELAIHMTKNHVRYPKQDNEHNALDDAKWNKRLHDFILKQ